MLGEILASRVREQAMRYIKWFGIALIAFGIGRFAFTELKYRRMIWEPFAMSVSVAPGSVDSSQFWVTPKEPYDVELTVKADDSNRAIAECLLGRGVYIDKSCLASDCVAGASWAITENGSRVASGNANMNRYEIAGMRQLGIFIPPNKGPFVLHVLFMKDGSSLAPYQPTLRVAVDPTEMELLVLAQPFYRFVAAAIAGLGLLVVVICEIVRFWQK